MANLPLGRPLAARIAIVFALSAAVLCSSTSAGRAQTAATIRVAVLPTESSAQVYYAKDMGFFAKAGLDVDIQLMQGAVATAIASNAVDIGYITVDTVASAHQKNIPLIVIAPAAEYVSKSMVRAAALVAPANSLVHQAKDLNGKIIAVAGLNGLSEIGPRIWIDQNGGDSSTVKFVEIPFPAMPAALESGRIDAAWVTEPFLELAKKNGRVLAYGFDGISKSFLLNAWCTTTQWAKDHPDLVNRFAAVMHETAIWANKNPTKSGEILAKYTKVDPTVIATMVRLHYGEQLTAASMQPLIDVAAKYGKFSSFPAQELLYLSPH